MSQIEHTPEETMRQEDSSERSLFERWMTPGKFTQHFHMYDPIVSVPLRSHSTRHCFTVHSSLHPVPLPLTLKLLWAIAGKNHFESILLLLGRLLGYFLITYIQITCISLSIYSHLLFTFKSFLIVWSVQSPPSLLSRATVDFIEWTLTISQALNPLCWGKERCQR